MDYRDALELATRAAREAGAILLREFHRPGGPRGPRGKAVVDPQVEALIRDLLEAAFPHHGIRAEEAPERDRAPAPGERHTWLIDPNDGTSAFQRGHRGPTVSIGLIREDRPVLGVVFAYAAPDDRGDLIAWAVGEPVTRNGIEVRRPPWKRALGAADVVLVSNSADARAAAYGQEIAPARYRPLPGIAYRLALAAVGEGEAAISLNEPNDYDVAGGHALIIGAGGDLFDESGQPLRYALDRPEQASFCFGGGPSVCEALAARPWRELLQSPAEARSTYDLCQPALDFRVQDPGRLARGQGCWLGQLVGDALGSQVEFEPADSIAQRWPEGVNALVGGGPHSTIAGQPTDDSELATLLARALVSERHYDADAVIRAYRWWLNSGPFDLGSTTSQALRAATGDHPAAAARAAASRTSQANGALMRAAPLGLMGHAWPEERLAALARGDAQLTHPHPICQDANVAFCLAIAFAVREGAGPREIYSHTLAGADALGLHPAVLQTLRAAGEDPPADYQRQMGWVLIALHNAFYQLNAADGFAAGLIDTVSRGGDADTNGCIAGALLGAVYGREQVPAPWRQGVLSCRPHADLPGVRRPRPKALWPVDALTLAERLLALSEGPKAATGIYPRLRT